jgi:hypothetical protein
MSTVGGRHDDDNIEYDSEYNAKEMIARAQGTFWLSYSRGAVYIVGDPLSRVKMRTDIMSNIQRFQTAVTSQYLLG